MTLLIIMIIFILLALHNFSVPHISLLSALLFACILAFTYPFVTFTCLSAGLWFRSHTKNGGTSI